MKCQQELGKDLPSKGAVYKDTVKDLKALETAIEDAKKEWKKEGGRIILKGTIEIDKDKNFSGPECSSGDKPIVIMPESIGGATIKGKGELKFNKVKNVWLYGINFEYKPSGKKDSFVTFKNATRCRIARCDFSTADKGEAPEHYYLTIESGDGNLIDHNTFHDKPKSLGSFLKIGNDWVKNTVIERNYFSKQALREMKNSQALRVGESDVGQKSFKAKVRYNLFEDCVSDEELITNKSSDNEYENNTFRRNVGSLTLRHGDGNEARNNVFEDNHRGIRIFGKNQKVLNNYFKNVPGGKDLSDNDLKDAEVAAIVVGMGGEGGYTRASKCKIEGNVIDNTDDANKDTKFDKAKVVMWGAGKGGQKPEDVDFVNNTILLNRGRAFQFKENVENDGKKFEKIKVFYKNKKEDVVDKLKKMVPKVEVVSSPPPVEKLKGLKADQVGPCSELNDYTFDKDVKRNFKPK